MEAFLNKFRLLLPHLSFIRQRLIDNKVVPLNHIIPMVYQYSMGLTNFTASSAIAENATNESKDEQLEKINLLVKNAVDSLVFYLKAINRWNVAEVSISNDVLLVSNFDELTEQDLKYNFSYIVQKFGNLSTDNKIETLPVVINEKKKSKFLIPAILLGLIILLK